MLIKHRGEIYDAHLSDDGTLDTVIIIEGKTYRISHEHAAEFRNADGSMTDEGFEELVKDILDSDLMDEEDEEELKDICDYCTRRPVVVKDKKTGLHFCRGCAEMQDIKIPDEFRR